MIRMSALVLGKHRSALVSHREQVAEVQQMSCNSAEVNNFTLVRTHRRPWLSLARDGFMVLTASDGEPTDLNCSRCCTEFMLVSLVCSSVILCLSVSGLVGPRIGSPSFFAVAAAACFSGLVFACFVRDTDCILAVQGSLSEDQAAPVFLQACGAGNSALVRALIASVPKPHQTRSSFRQTYFAGMRCAVAAGHENVVRALTEGPQAVHRPDGWLVTDLLAVAAQRQHWSVVRLLLQPPHARCCDFEDYWFVGPAAAAAMRREDATTDGSPNAAVTGEEQLWAILRLPEVYLSRGYRVALGTALTVAASAGDEDAISFLIGEACTCPRRPDRIEQLTCRNIAMEGAEQLVDGSMALQAAAAAGHLATVKQLLHGIQYLGGDVSVQQASAWALVAAAGSGRLDIFRWLERGALMAARTRALAAASGVGCLPIVELLLSDPAADVAAACSFSAGHPQLPAFELLLRDPCLQDDPSFLGRVRHHVNMALEGRKPRRRLWPHCQPAITPVSEGVDPSAEALLQALLRSHDHCGDPGAAFRRHAEQMLRVAPARATAGAADYARADHSVVAVDDANAAASRLRAPAVVMAAFCGHSEVLHRLLAAPQLVAEPFPCAARRKALLAAAAGGQTVIVAELLADPLLGREALDAHVLSCACSGGHEEVVAALLADSRVDPLLRLPGRVAGGELPVEAAAFGGSQSALQLLLSDPRIDPMPAFARASRVGSCGLTAMQRAVVGLEVLLEDPRVDAAAANNAALYEAAATAAEKATLRAQWHAERREGRAASSLRWPAADNRRDACALHTSSIVALLLRHHGVRRKLSCVSLHTLAAGVQAMVESNVAVGAPELAALIRRCLPRRQYPGETEANAGRAAPISHDDALAAADAASPLRVSVTALAGTSLQRICEAAWARRRAAVLCRCMQLEW